MICNKDLALGRNWINGQKKKKRILELRHSKSKYFLKERQYQYGCGVIIVCLKFKNNNCEEIARL